MAFSIVVITPPPLPVAALTAAIEKTLDHYVDEVRSDFQSTVATWSDKPVFLVRSRPGFREISTRHKVYGMLNVGTRPHTIVARGRALVFQVPYRAKTAPRVIGSGGGGKGNQQVFTREVSHPGTEAREWDQAIAEKVQLSIGTVMQAAISAAVP